MNLQLQIKYMMCCSRISFFKVKFFLFFVMIVTPRYFYSQIATMGLNNQYTLDRVIAIATDSSLSAFRAKNLYLSGYWQYRSYRADRLPSVLLSSTPFSYRNVFVERYDYTNNRDVYMAQQALYSEANLSINQNIDWTGGTLYFDTEFGYLKNMGYSNYEQFTTVPFRIGYSQKLFGFNSFKWDKKLEPLKYEKTKKQLLYNLEEIAEKTTGYFFSMAMNEKLYELAQQNINNSDTLYRIGEERYKIGSISQSDLLTLKLNLINAKSSLGNIKLDLQKSKYNLMTVLRIEDIPEFMLIVPEEIPDFDIEKDEAIHQAFINNPIYLEQQEIILTNQQSLDKMIKNQHFNASINASVGFNQVSDKFSTSYRNPLRQDILSLGLTVPILDWGVNKGKVNIAKRNLEAARITSQQISQTFQNDVISTVNEFQFRKEQIKLVLEARYIANQALDKAKKLFQIGKTDVTSVNNTVSKQIEAESNYISVLSSFWSCYYKIRKLTLYDFQSNKTISVKFEELNGY